MRRLINWWCYALPRKTQLNIIRAVVGFGGFAAWLYLVAFIDWIGWCDDYDRPFLFATGLGLGCMSLVGWAIAIMCLIFKD